jgi:uncharacterized protein (UPF0276 family)
MLLENPSTYLAFADSTMSETDFLREIVARTDCGLLLDVNNVYVSCTNQQTDPVAYLADFPLQAVGEIHLGGHDTDHDEYGAPLLIDSHAAEVVDPVWRLYEHVLELAGPKPTLIEWDTDVPVWNVLASEARRATYIMNGVRAA